MVFKTTSLFIKVVCLNNTYNLILVSSAYNNFDYLFIFFHITNTPVENRGILDRTGGGGGGGGGGEGPTRTERFHKFSCVILGSFPVYKKLGTVQFKNHFWNTLVTYSGPSHYHN